MRVRRDISFNRKIFNPTVIILTVMVLTVPYVVIPPPQSTTQSTTQPMTQPMTQSTTQPMTQPTPFHCDHPNVEKIFLLMGGTKKWGRYCHPPLLINKEYMSHVQFV